MAVRSIIFVAIMLFGASYAPRASANGPANTNEWFESLGLPTPPPLFLPNGQPFPQQSFHAYQPPKFGNGMSMSSSSSSNGPGGSTVTITHNGETQTFTVGDNPPPAFEPSAPKRPKKPTAPKMLNLKFPKMEPIKPFVFKPLVFAPIPEPKMIDPEEIRNAKPDPNKNEHFIQSSSSSFSSSSNDNGKIKTTGGMMSISNIDGHVTERSFIINGGNEDEDENEV